jgi:CheY-like chemotaxis protein
MKKEIVVLIADDDEGHVALIKKNLKRAGLLNEIKHFKDGQEILDFLLGNGKDNTKQKDTGYLLLLDIRMPKVDGEEVLRRIKEHKELHKIPVIMITTTDDPREVEKCHLLGCNSYVTKPVDYDKFVEVIRQLGLFLLVVEVPKIKGEN